MPCMWTWVRTKFELKHLNTNIFDLTTRIAANNLVLTESDSIMSNIFTLRSYDLCEGGPCSRRGRSTVHDPRSRCKVVCRKQSLIVVPPILCTGKPLVFDLDISSQALFCPKTYKNFRKISTNFFFIYFSIFGLHIKSWSWPSLPHHHRIGNLGSEQIWIQHQKLVLDISPPPQSQRCREFGFLADLDSASNVGPRNPPTPTI